jgi:hypothetical protein
MNVRRELEKLGHVAAPKIYLDPSCSPQDQTRLKAVIQRLGGLVANTAGRSLL